MYFIDANPIAYAANPSPDYDSCRALLSAIATGQLVASTAVNVIEEVWHLVFSRCNCLNVSVGVIPGQGLVRAVQTLKKPLRLTTRAARAA